MFWGLDARVSAALNAYVGRSWTLDTFCVLVASNFLFKGAWVVALYPWAWFQGDEKDRGPRALLVSGLLAAVASVPLSRVIGGLLPFRERPIRNPLLHLHLAAGLAPDTLLHWTSFPSDHAALFAALATTLLWVSWPVGLLACCYVLAVIDLPRLYLGIHYPTDILAGTVLGVGVALLAVAPAVRNGLAGPSLRVWERRPGVFYAGFTLLLYLIGTVFGEVPEILRFTATVLASVWHRLGAAGL